MQRDRRAEAHLGQCPRHRRIFSARCPSTSREIEDGRFLLEKPHTSFLSRADGKDPDTPEKRVATSAHEDQVTRAPVARVVVSVDDAGSACTLIASTSPIPCTPCVRDCIGDNDGPGGQPALGSRRSDPAGPRFDAGGTTVAGHGLRPGVGRTLTPSAAVGRAPPRAAVEARVAGCSARRRARQGRRRYAPYVRVGLRVRITIPTLPEVIAQRSSAARPSAPRRQPADVAAVGRYPLEAPHRQPSATVTVRRNAQSGTRS